MTGPTERRQTSVGVGPADARAWNQVSLGAPKLLLAIDTSSRTGGVALLDGTVILAEENWLGGGNQTAQVLPVVSRICEQAGRTVGELEAVVVATGPGSFTGLRVGASLGKGLAVALRIPLIGIPTLDAAAYQHRHVSGTILAVVSAGRGLLYAGVYRSTARGLRRSGEFLTLTAEELAETASQLGPSPLVCGELEPAVIDSLHGATPATVRLVSPAARLRRTAFLGELGLWELVTRGPADPASLQPIYLRRG